MEDKNIELLEENGQYELLITYQGVRLRYRDETPYGPGGRRYTKEERFALLLYVLREQGVLTAQECENLGNHVEIPSALP